MTKLIKLASSEDGRESLHMTKERRPFLIIKKRIIPITVGEAQVWVTKHCPDKFKEIFRFS